MNSNKEDPEDIKVDIGCLNCLIAFFSKGFELDRLIIFDFFLQNNGEFINYLYEYFITTDNEEIKLYISLLYLVLTPIPEIFKILKTVTIKLITLLFLVKLYYWNK